MIADLAHAQGGLVGYVHPFDWDIDPPKRKGAHQPAPRRRRPRQGRLLEVVGFCDHKSTADVWYRLLNLGYRMPAGAGTDAMANYASLRGPVGMNRVFLDTGRATTPGGVKRCAEGRAQVRQQRSVARAAGRRQAAGRHGRWRSAAASRVPRRIALAGCGRSPRAGATTAGS